MLASGMINGPDLPPRQGGAPGDAREHAGVRRPGQQAERVRYVVRLLLWQGAAWIVLAALGLGFWTATLPPGFGTGGPKTALLWAGAELLAIAIGASLGAAQLGMGVRLRGGPRLELAIGQGLQGVTLAAGLVVAALTVMIAGSVLAIIALTGAQLVVGVPAGTPCRRENRGWLPADAGFSWCCEPVS